MFAIIYMIYIMILNLPITQLSLSTIRIQKHLWKNLPLKHRKMKVYIITFQEKHETLHYSIMLLLSEYCSNFIICTLHNTC